MILNKQVLVYMYMCVEFTHTLHYTLDDQTQPTFEMTPGFKPFTIIHCTQQNSCMQSLNSSLYAYMLKPRNTQPT